MPRNHYGPAPCSACKGRGYVEVEASNEDGTMQRSERAACGECYGTGFALSADDARSPVVRAIGDVAWRLRSAGIGDVFGPWEPVEVIPPDLIGNGLRSRKATPRRRVRGGAR
jgi:hypothetical protein